MRFIHIVCYQYLSLHGSLKSPWPLNIICSQTNDYPQESRFLGFNVNKKDIYTSKPGSMPTRFYTLA